MATERTITGWSTSEFASKLSGLALGDNIQMGDVQQGGWVSGEANSAP